MALCVLSLLALTVFTLTSCDDGEVTSVGLSFKLNEDGESYTVVGMGVCLDEHVIIDTYRKKPITAIADMAFNSNNDITAITLGSSVREIGKYAFASCDNLTEINLSEGLEVIHPNAFYGCDELESVRLPDSLKVIEPYAFEYCTALRSVELGDSLESIGNFAFYSCYSLKSVSFGDKLSIIGKSAFSNCRSLTSASFGESINLISEDAFSGCSALTELNFVPSPLNIGESAFRMCYSLRTLTLPEGTRSLGRGAFSKCDALETVNFGNTIKAIGTEAFFACRSIKHLTLPDSLTNISGYAFEECTGLESISLPFIGMRSSDTSGAHLGNIFGSTNATLVPTSLKQVIVRGKAIPSNAFRGCENIESIIISGSPSVGSYAFRECTGLVSVKFLDGVRSIGSNLFYDCDALEEVEITSDVTSIGASAFQGCVNLKKVTTNDLGAWCKISFANSAACPLYYSADFYANGSLVEELVIPEGTNYIGSYAFCGSKINSVTLHDNVTNVHATAFDNCENLSLPEYDGALYVGTAENPYSVLLRAKTSDVISVKVHPAARIIGNSAFFDCISLNSITLPSSLQIICNYAFRNCSRLAEITIPKEVVSIGYQAFLGCNSLSRVILLETAVWQISGGEEGTLELPSLQLSDPTLASELFTGEYAARTWYRRNPV